MQTRGEGNKRICSSTETETLNARVNRLSLQVIHNGARTVYYAL